MTALATAPPELPPDVARIYAARADGKRLSDASLTRLRDWERLEQLIRLRDEGVALSEAGQARIEEFEQGRIDEAAERERLAQDVRAAVEVAEADLLDARAAVEKILAPLELAYAGAIGARTRYEIAWAIAATYDVQPVRLEPRPGIGLGNNARW